MHSWNSLKIDLLHNRNLRQFTLFTEIQNRNLSDQFKMFSHGFILVHYIKKMFDTFQMPFDVIVPRMG